MTARQRHAEADGKSEPIQPELGERARGTVSFIHNSEKLWRPTAKRGSALR
jgi:hypothetical protein